MKDTEEKKDKEEEENEIVNMRKTMTTKGKRKISRENKRDSIPNRKEDEEEGEK